MAEGAAVGAAAAAAVSDVTPFWEFEAAGRSRDATLRLPGNIILRVRAYLKKDAVELQAGNGERASFLTPEGELPLFSLEEACNAAAGGSAGATVVQALARDALHHKTFFSQPKHGGPNGIYRVTADLPPRANFNDIKSRVFVDAVVVMRLVYSQYGCEAVRLLTARADSEMLAKSLTSTASLDAFWDACSGAVRNAIGKRVDAFVKETGTAPGKPLTSLAKGGSKSRVVRAAIAGLIKTLGGVVVLTLHRP